ncbi:succinate-semialdehyde dehydrogenase [Gonapodya prolifera JEL478]|uniref:succinate-semialdehyde dehydrogenase [NAD(P)(+)] n=1 Tax=Gonapodya prolifera (strain JEL478) TaxID=1344416 RepID=A0A139A9C7_GONPJ|nr:succinate-semialdehyde dehydrogenase [Gonapodya prolifera JEL478]|eukprot:KXS13431.1 succinate-semialdehyde dehydrogenase [Gonapodya prolifera JEL478]
MSTLAKAAANSLANTIRRLNIKETGLLRSSAYIGGQWVDAADGRTFPVNEPATGQHIADVPNMTENEVKEAVKAAKAAQKSWAGRTAKERHDILNKWFALQIAHTEDIASILAAESGKPLPEAKGEVAYGASFIQWFAEEATRAYGDVIPQNVSNRRLVAIKQPVGVCSVLTPWNFPSAMLTRKAGAALAAGCTVVAKPAAETPLTTLALIHLANLAGVPAGVLNAVTCDNVNVTTVGKEMATNPDVAKVSFTGSTAVGKLLMSQASGTIKKISLELGGNAAFIVFDDADVDAAVAGCIASKFRNTGQTCVSVNRIYAQAGIHDQFVQKLAEKLKGLKVGIPTDPGVNVGPLISERGLAKVESHVEDAKKKGAKVVLGGKRHELQRTFYEPTLLADIIAKEETFGPVASVFKFSTEEEVIALANDVDFGLASYFYSRDIGRCWRVAEALEVGMVGINEGIISTAEAPFGGSGLGREGSKYGIDEYMHVKYLCFGGI